MLFLVCTLIIIFSVILVMPKRLTKVEYLFVGIWSSTFQGTVDRYLSGKLDWYGYFHRGQTDWGYLAVELLLHPGFTLIFYNYFPYDKTIFKKILYILGWTAIGGFYQWSALHTTFFYNNEWKIWHSLLLFPVLFYVNILMFRLFRKWNKTL